jgi:hypothetical protein
MTTTTPMHTISIDGAGNVHVDGQPIGARLTGKQEQMFRLIMSHSHVATHEFIRSALYGGRDEPDCDGNIANVFANKIRAKLGAHRGAIQTAFGRGYHRGPGYQLERPCTGTVAVNIDASQLEKIAHATGEVPELLMERLINEELSRVWSQVAA